ncbi:hypothetical protein MESS2_1530016 [Mesorhizobium metallidurans STM 2683]|uniref:Uncharacterized protein n=1 Tax=Mesorhizobium metallidurans STM 2683 TaxID=1297569 RepID=M5EM98_9HYPH|nr:hypothetical protein MESS2_1530016 [Mesorhizobium metallidurans STM 2683]
MVVHAAHFAHAFDGELDGDRAGLLEGQSGGKLLAFLGLPLEADEHQMITAGLERDLAAGRDFKAAADRPHGHDAVLDTHFVQSGLVRHIGRNRQQPVRRAAIVDHGEVAARDLGAGRRGPRPGMLDFEIADLEFMREGRLGANEQKGEGEDNDAEALLDSAKEGVSEAGCARMRGGAEKVRHDGSIDMISRRWPVANNFSVDECARGRFREPRWLRQPVVRAGLMESGGGRSRDARTPAA